MTQPEISMYEVVNDQLKNLNDRISNHKDEISRRFDNISQDIRYLGDKIDDKLIDITEKYDDYKELTNNKFIKLYTLIITGSIALLGLVVTINRFMR